MEGFAHLAIHWLITDRPDQALALIQAMPVETPVIDLAAEASLLLDGGHPSGWETFDPADHAVDLWADLEAPLEPWIAMFGFSSITPAPPWLVPGLEDLQRLLWLADRLAAYAQHSAHPVLTVVLPPLPQALPLLRLALRGPELIASLWDPLLSWWGETRQKLSHLEMVLRLQLPAADSLRPPVSWLERLQLLADCLGDESRTDVVLALCGDVRSWSLQRRKLAALPLSGVPLTRLWIAGEGWDALPVEGWNPPMHLAASGGGDVQASLRGLWSSPLQSPPLVEWIQRHEEEGADLLCRLFAPGVEKNDLRVHCREGELIVAALGHRCVVPLPEESLQMEPVSAKVRSPFLEVGFR